MERMTEIEMALLCRYVKAIDMRYLRYRTYRPKSSNQCEGSLVLLDSEIRHVQHGAREG